MPDLPNVPNLPNQRKERGGFNPNRLGEAQRPQSVIPRIVGGGPLPRAANAPVPEPTPLIPPATPAQRALLEEETRPHAEPKGFTEVRIIGVGGGGGNAVSRMIEAGVAGVEFIAVNTDPQALEQSQATRTVHLGGPSGRRLGAGGDPGIGQRAAEEMERELEDVVGGADMVFITAGMGGGTGTGAAPIIAKIAKRQRALTVGVVTLPFRFEGARRMQSALEGVARMRESVDALIVIPNDRLLNMADRSTSMVQAFRLADDMLRHGVQGIADLVTVTGLINLDFADVRSVMENAGSALMSIGQGNGPDRAREAAQAVVASPLLEHSIAGARGILLNITGGPDLTLHEVSEVAEYVTQAVSPEANIIFGAVIHPRPEVELRVTLIATGMPEEAPSQRQGSRQADYRQESRSEPRREFRPDYRAPRTEAPAEPPQPDAREWLRQHSRDSRSPREDRDTREPRPRETVNLPDDADPLDVPPFLRRLR
ncbi:MAG TPA: cell division protein FtsZ [Chloroflexota bacterium]|nr:cell division protein FtsZ [Chloroflexota bacterium]